MNKIDKIMSKTNNRLDINSIKECLDKLNIEYIEVNKNKKDEIYND